MTNVGLGFSKREDITMTNPVTIESLKRQLVFTEKRVAYAWAQYYNSIRAELVMAHGQWAVMETTLTCEDVRIPLHIKDELLKMASELHKKWECPVCINMITPEELDITNCGHFYCKDCLVELKRRTAEDGKWKCCVCRRKHRV